MRPDQWEQVQEIFHEALLLNPEQLPAFLEQRCGADAEIRGEVEGMLEAAPAAADFLEGPASEYIADEEVPARVGNYRIVREAGRGGMATVYLGERADGQFEKQVAVKVLRCGIYGDDPRRRFLRERQVLARLDHPNIVRLLDAGVTEDGRPWLVEEFVDGEPVTRYAASRSLPAGRRIALFLQVCGAVEHAHRQGVLHRDLKPGNILVSREGTPKLLDFGIAKQMEGAPWGDRTVTGMLVWTPGYAAPEQIRGEPLSRATDVYGLGLVLYELLFEEPFHDTRQRASHEIARSIVEDEPALEGVPEKLRPVLARSLAREPGARYATAGELAAALRPLAAEPEPKGLRVGGGRVRTRGKAARGGWMLAACGAAAMALGGSWLLTGPALPGTSQASSFPLTTEPGNEWSVDLSRDGRSAVYISRGEKGCIGSRIVVKPVGEGAPRAVTPVCADYRAPRWSPDGGRIAFAVETGGAMGIYVIPSGGGEAERVAQAGDPALTAVGRDIRWQEWTADGKGLIVVDRPDPSQPAALFVLDLESRTRRRLTQPPSDMSGDVQSAASPDGRWVAFVRQAARVEADVYVIAAQGGEARRLTADHLVVDGIAWMPDSRQIVFSSARLSSLKTLWRVPVGGGAPSRVAGVVDASVWPSVAQLPGREGFRLAYQSTSLSVNLAAWDRSRPADAAPEPVCPSTAFDWHAQISPDGRRTAFSSRRGGASNIWICEPDGQARQLTRFAGSLVDSPRWSPDGRRLVFTARGEASREVFLCDPATRASRPLTRDALDDGRASFSMDGRWIYFRSSRSGRDEIWKMPETGGAARQITRNGAREAFESPDGKLLYFVKDRPMLGLYRTGTEGGGETWVTGGVRDTRWAVARDGVYFVSMDRPFRIERYGYATGKVETVYRIPGRDPVWAGFAVSPDGSRFVWPQTVRDSSDLMVLDGVR